MIPLNLLQMELDDSTERSIQHRIKNDVSSKVNTISATPKQLQK